MKYDIYDTTFSYGIPYHKAVDKETVMMLVLSNPKLIVVDEGEKCPPFNPDLAEIYADIKQRLKNANRNNPFAQDWQTEIEKRIKEKNDKVSNNLPNNAR